MDDQFGTHKVFLRYLKVTELNHRREESRNPFLRKVIGTLTMQSKDTSNRTSWEVVTSSAGRLRHGEAKRVMRQLVQARCL